RSSQRTFLPSFAALAAASYAPPPFSRVGVRAVLVGAVAFTGAFILKLDLPKTKNPNLSAKRQCSTRSNVLSKEEPNVQLQRPWQDSTTGGLPPYIYRDCDRARAAQLSTPIGSRVVKAHRLADAAVSPIGISRPVKFRNLSAAQSQLFHQDTGV